MLAILPFSLSLLKKVLKISKDLCVCSFKLNNVSHECTCTPKLQKTSSFNADWVTLCHALWPTAVHEQRHPWHWDLHLGRWTPLPGTVGRQSHAWQGQIHLVPRTQRRGGMLCCSAASTVRPPRPDGRMYEGEYINDIKARNTTRTENACNNTWVTCVTCVTCEIVWVLLTHLNFLCTIYIFFLMLDIELDCGNNFEGMHSERLFERPFLVLVSMGMVCSSGLMVARPGA